MCGYWKLFFPYYLSRERRKVEMGEDGMGGGEGRSGRNFQEEDTPQKEDGEAVEVVGEEVEVYRGCS